MKKDTSVSIKVASGDDVATITKCAMMKSRGENWSGSSIKEDRGKIAMSLAACSYGTRNNTLAISGDAAVCSSRNGRRDGNMQLGKTRRHANVVADAETRLRPGRGTYRELNDAWNPGIPHNQSRLRYSASARPERGAFPRRRMSMALNYARDRA